VTKDFVVDASIGIAWVHPAQATTRSQALLQAICDGAIVREDSLRHPCFRLDISITQACKIVYM
jgi:hypothetical protein